MSRRQRLAALERRRTAAPVAIEFQGQGETAEAFAARLLAAYGDPPRVKIIAFHRDETPENPPRDNSR